MRINNNDDAHGCYYLTGNWNSERILKILKGLNCLFIIDGIYFNHTQNDVV